MNYDFDITLSELRNNLDLYDDDYEIWDEYKNKWVSAKSSTYIVDNAGEFPKPNKAKHPINAVTVYDSIEQTFYAFGLEYEGSGTYSLDRLDSETRAMVEDLNVEYFAFNNEVDLVRNLLQHCSDHGYDCITGWNSEGFDVPYIVNRSYNILGQQQTKRLLSPFNMIDHREFKNDFGQVSETYKIIGMPHLDYLQMYKKHTFTPRESYKLDFIAQEELGEKKLSYEEEKNLATLYENNYAKFIAYNIRDVDLMVKLDDKLGLFGLTYAMMYYSLSNFEDTLGTVKIWEQLIAKFLYTKNKVPPFKRQSTGEDRDFEGAYVKEPIKGFHDWVVSFDLSSLYPHLEQQFNIGPETIVKDVPDELVELRKKVTFDDLLEGKADVTETLKKHKVTMAPNKEFYRLDKMSFFSEIKRGLYSERKGYKKRMLEAEQKKVDATTKEDKLKYEYEEAKFDNLQMGLKILLNGGYGAVGNKAFLYYMVENAEAITTSGQLVNRWTGIRIDNFLKEIFSIKSTSWTYGDTDSLYFTIKPFVDTLNINDKQKLIDTVDQFCEEVLSPKFKEVCQNLSDYLNCYEQRMFWDREVIADHAIWCCHPDTKIYLSDGTQKRIEDLYLHNSKYHENSKTSKYLSNINTLSYNIDEQCNEADEAIFIHRKYYSGTMYKLEYNGKILNVTEDHKILTKNKDTGVFNIWKKAKDLTESDELLI